MYTTLALSFYGKPALVHHWTHTQLIPPTVQGQRDWSQKKSFDKQADRIAV